MRKTRAKKYRLIRARISAVSGFLAVFFVLLFLFPLNFGSTADNGFPRLANYYHVWEITDAEAVALSKWDMIILDMEVQENSRAALQKIRLYNPKIKILAYVTSQEMKQDAGSFQNGRLRAKLLAGFNANWWLKNSAGTQLSYWPGSWLINITNNAPAVIGRRWNTYLPQFMHDQVMSSGLWDGIFYDNMWSGVSFVSSDIDANGDGRADDATTLDQGWRDGMLQILKTSRQLEGNSKIIIGNGSSYGGYFQYANGRLFEDFPTPYEGSGSWSDNMGSYDRILSAVPSLQTVVINRTTRNVGDNNNYQSFRYGLSSALLADGYYSFDYGDQGHNRLWWYDEYDVHLGLPISSAYNVADSKVARFVAGVWRRDFDLGVVFVNPTEETKTISLGLEELEKISGSQDPSVNDGSLINYIRLAPEDGIVLLRPLSKILDSPFNNGSFARIFDVGGERLRSGFFSFDSRFTASDYIDNYDINKDGAREYVVGNKNKVLIYDAAGQKITEFFPYGDKYDRGVNIAVGDVNGDGYPEIITGTENGGGPHIRIFNYQGKLINSGFFAFAKNFRGGVNVAVGDLNGDGIDEIVAGAGVTGGPQIQIFNQDGKLISAGWFAYDRSFHGGVNVAVGAVNGDGAAEIVTGPGYGGAPQVKVFNSRGQLLNSGFLAYDINNRGGVKISVTDINNDGVDEILALTKNVVSVAGF